jgi:hypothetical protein
MDISIIEKLKKGIELPLDSRKQIQAATSLPVVVFHPLYQYGWKNLCGYHGKLEIRDGVSSPVICIPFRPRWTSKSRSSSRVTRSVINHVLISPLTNLHSSSRRPGLTSHYAFQVEGHKPPYSHVCTAQRKTNTHNQTGRG